MFLLIDQQNVDCYLEYLRHKINYVYSFIFYDGVLFKFHK